MAAEDNSPKFSSHISEPGQVSMFRSVAEVTQTELDYGYCNTGKTLIFLKSCTGIYLNYRRAINFITHTTADLVFPKAVADQCKTLPKNLLSC